MNQAEVQTDSVIAFDFKADSVLKELGIETTQTAEIKSIRFIFAQESAWNPNKIPAALHNSEALRQTANKVRHKLDAVEKFETGFFKNSPYSRDALIIALLCDDLIIDANNHAASSDEDFTSPSKDFDPETFKLADRIWGEAVEFEASKPATNPDYLPESLFLAQINTLLGLDEFYHLIENQEYDELVDMQPEFIPASTAFIDPTTPLGEEIFILIADIQQEISSRRPPATIHALFPAKPLSPEGA